MTRLLLLALVLFCACRRPLEPGETRCVTTGSVTNCRTGQAPPPPVYVHGFYCTRRADGFGVCHRAAVECERLRYADAAFGPCARQDVAACTGVDCFVDRESCEKFADLYERQKCEPVE